MIPDEILRTALEELITPGAGMKPPVEERIARRLSAVDQQTRDAALAAAKEAVDTAYSLAREYTAGKRSQVSVEKALAERYPWLRGPDAPPVDAPLWRRWLYRGPNMVYVLGAYGHRLAIY